MIHVKNETIHEDGTITRERRGFLFRPMELDGLTRWLVFAKWIEEYTDGPTFLDFPFWWPIHWA